MKALITLAVALLSAASGQTTNSYSPYSSIPSAPVPTLPPLGQNNAPGLVANIPSCWAPCVGGAIKEVCPLDDTWACACNAYVNPDSPNFIQMATYDSVCENCSPNVGASDGGEQGMCNFLLLNCRIWLDNWTWGWLSSDIEGLLVNICIAIPLMDTSSILSASAATPTSSTSPKPTKNAAPTISSKCWQLFVVPFALFGGLALV